MDQDKRHTNSGKKSGDKSDLLTKTEMDSLMQVVAGDLYYTTLYTVLKYSGRRIGEIYGHYKNNKWIGGIKKEDLNFESNTIHTIILKTRKQKIKRECLGCHKIENSIKINYCSNCGTKLEEIDKSRLKEIEPTDKYIPMREEVKRILLLFINNHNPKFKDKDYIFREISLKKIQKDIKKHIKKAGITKKFSIHGFRTYFISNMIRIGLTENQIASWTGHVDINSLKSYNRLVPDDVKDKINSLDM